MNNWPHIHMPPLYDCAYVTTHEVKNECRLHKASPHRRLVWDNISQTASEGVFNLWFKGRQRTDSYFLSDFPSFLHIPVGALLSVSVKESATTKTWPLRNFKQPLAGALFWMSVKNCFRAGFCSPPPPTTSLPWLLEVLIRVEWLVSTADLQGPLSCVGSPWAGAVGAQ